MPGEKSKKARRDDAVAPPLDVSAKKVSASPAARLEAMTRELISWLEKEHQRHLEAAERLQEVVNRLAPENARLLEALANAQSNNLVSTVLVVVGGAVISYATFVSGVGHHVANIGLGLLLGGIVIMLWAQASRWSRASKGS